MKQLVFALVATFLLFAPEAYAHTYLVSTNTGNDTTEKIESDVTSLVDTLKDEADSDASDEGSFWTLVIVIAIIVVILGILTIYITKRLYTKKRE